MNDNIKGGALMALGMASITINDVFMRVVLEELPLFQTMFLRGIIMIPLMLVYILLLERISLRLNRNDALLVGLRAALELLAATLFFSAIVAMPFANLSALMQAVPLTVSLAAALFLGHSVGWRRWVAIGIGLAGVLLIIRPGPGGFECGAVLGAATVAVVTARDLLTRSFSANVPSSVAALATAIAVGLGGGIASLFAPWGEVSTGDMGLLFCASLFAIVAYITMVAAVRVGEIAFVAPFRYTALVCAVLLGLVVFDERPDLWVWIGAALVVGTGLFTMYREHRVRG